MNSPAHPGLIIQHDCLEPLGLTTAARPLGVSRQALNKVVTGQSAISADMALRLSKALDTRPELWLHLQSAYDLAQVKQREREIKVTPFNPPSAA